MLLDRNAPQFNQNFHELSFGGEANETLEADLMQLDDRAINYQSHPPHLELNQGEIGDIACGTRRQKYPRHIRANQSIDLKYGQDADCTGAIEIAPPTHATAAPENNRQQALAELRSIHLSNIRRNLEHRLQVAREKGNENLIRLLSAELEQIG